MRAGKRLNREMNTLMPLQIMIAIKALGTLITLERPVMNGTNAGC